MYSRESFASSGIIAIIYTPAHLAALQPSVKAPCSASGGDRLRHSPTYHPPDLTHFPCALLRHSHQTGHLSQMEHPASVADGTSSQKPRLHPVQKMNTPSCTVSCTKGTQCLCCPNASAARTLNSVARTWTQTPSHRRSPPHATSLMESREPHQALCCTPVTVPCHCLSERDTPSPATALMAHPGQSAGGNLVGKAATSACMSEICCSGFRVQNILK
jgi:hypothetical protein